MFEFARNTLLGLTAALALSATAAEAVTVVTENGIYNISYGDEFIGGVDASGGAGTWMVQFDATEDPLAAGATATLTNIVAGTFTNLVMSWIAVSDSFILATTSVAAGETNLETVFTFTGILGGDDTRQWLVFSWDNSLAGASFDFDVVAAAAPVPLPAGGMLLICALGGLAALRRRKLA